MKVEDEEDDARESLTTALVQRELSAKDLERTRSRLARAEQALNRARKLDAAVSGLDTARSGPFNRKHTAAKDSSV